MFAVYIVCLILGFDGLQVSESSNSYMITGRIDPFMKHNIKVYFSEGKKYLIVAVGETLSSGCATFTKMERKFRIADKYDLNSVQYDTTDKFFTITIKVENQRFYEGEEPPEEQVNRKKKRESLTVAAGLDRDMRISSEGEPFPRHVVERRFYPEVLQRKIEIPPDLKFPEINEDTNTNMRREKRIGEQIMESEKKATAKSEKITEQNSGVQSQEIADDSEEAAEMFKNFKVVSSLSDEDNGDERRLEEKTERENDGKSQEESKATEQEREEDEEAKVDKRESREILTMTTLAKVKQKEGRGLEVENTADAGSEDLKEIATKIPPKVSKQQPDEGEERDDKDSKKTAPETPLIASKEQTDEGDKAETRHCVKCTNSRGEIVWIEIELEQKARR